MTTKLDFAGIEITGAGNPVVFLHSSLSSNKQWLTAIKQLSECFTCINVDISGYGRAPIVLDKVGYSFAFEINRIESCLKSLGFDEQSVHLVGHSCGGAIALAMAVKAPEKVASLALFEPVAFHLLKTKCSAYYQQIADFAMQLKRMPDGKAAQAFVDFWNGDGFYLALPNKVQQQMAVAMEKVHLDFQGILAEQYQLADLSNLLCPALIMVGEQTQPVSKVLSEEIYQHLANAKKRQLPGGHMAPISHNEQVTQSLMAFLKRN